MALIKWDPFREITIFREKLDRVLEDTFPKWEKEKGLPATEWSPSVDVHETDKSLVVTAEVPGIDEKDLTVEVEGRTLILKGKREFEKETKREDYHRIERAYGSFYRTFEIPESVDPDKIEAAWSKGLLRITLPKRPGLKPKRVKILPEAESKK